MTDSTTPPDRLAACTILARDELHRGFMRVERLTLETRGRDGRPKRLMREIETHGGGVAVLPYDPVARTCVLVRQLRAPLLITGDGPLLTEVVAGLRDVVGEAPDDAARREAMEEAGLVLGTLTHVGSAYPMPGLSTEKVELYLAEIDLAAARVSDGGGAIHEDEDIEVVVIGLAALAALADAGELPDLKTLALIQTLRLRRPDLFN